MPLDPNHALLPRRKFRSLERKVIAPLVVVFLIVSALTVAAMSMVYATHRSQRAADEARSLARSIVQLRMDQQNELSRYIAGIAKDVPVHLVVIVAGTPPTVVASTRDAWVGLPLSEIQEPGVVGNIKRVISTKKDVVVEYAAVGTREHITPYGVDGAALVLVDTVLVNRDMWYAAMQQGIIALAGIASFGIATTLLLRRRVTGRISALSSSVDQDATIFDGSTHHIERFDDEITVLAENIEGSLARERSSFAELERLALVARKTTNAVVITDAKRRILWVNEGFTRITGYTLDEVVGRVPGDVLQTTNTAKETVQRMRKALELGEGCRVELLNRAKDGREYWLDIEIQPLHDAAGVLTGFMAIESDITVAVRARESIAQSERQQKLIVVGANIGTWDWNVATGEVGFNERWCRMLGYEPGELEPTVRVWMRLVHPDDRARITGVLKAHFDGKSDFCRCEHRLRHKNGSFIWVHDAGKVYERDAQGKPLRMSGVHLDISERRLAEERFELAVRGSAAGIWDWDLKTNANYMSARFKEMLGFAADEPMETYDGWAKLLHPDDRAGVMKILDAHLHGGAQYSADFRLKHSSGQYRWYHAHGQAVWNEEGKPMRMAGSLEDIHERRVLEGARAQLAAIILGSEDSILGVTLDGKITSVNAAASRMFGVEVGALMGKCELNEVPEPLRAHERDALARVGRGERVEQYESRRMRSDGTSVEVSVSLSPVFDESGRVVAASKIVRDISERSEKRELEKLNALLARQNRKLEDMTERAHRFVDDVSHEFRTPLTVIREYSSIIADGLGGAVTTQQSDWLQIIDVAALDLNQMVEDFLDSSKLRAGRLRVDRRACTVLSIVAGVRRMIARKAASRGIKVVDAFDPDLPLVFADEEKVRRIIMNLMTNAIKFSPDRGTIILGAHTTVKGDVEISVTDHGPGLAPSDLKQLFERFGQLPNALAASVKGFGLGLNIARQLVWLNLGKISVASEYRKGATFSFTLPSLDRRLIVDRFFERLAEREGPPSGLGMLRIGLPADQASREDMRRLVVGATMPGDIVLESGDARGLMVFGPTDSVAIWRQRLVDGLRHNGHDVADASAHADAHADADADADVVVSGSWRYPAEIEVARAAISASVQTEPAHVA